jgi:hypothetical protein
MSVTARNPFENGRWDVTETCPWCPMMLTPIMVIKTAAVKEIVSQFRQCIMLDYAAYLPIIEMNDATLKYAIPLSVRGTVNTKHITAETTAQTIEHDAPSVTAQW